MFPVFLDLTGRLAVVVGGGRVGRRKAAGLRSAGAAVRVVSLEARPADEGDPVVEWRQGTYEAADLDGAMLVFAAAGPEVNARVVADARARGVWVADASDPAAGDLHTPAVLRRGSLTVAVSTTGAAPLLARQVRDEVDRLLDPTFTEHVLLLGELRPQVLARIGDEERHRVLERLSEPGWRERLRQEGVERVRQEMQGVVDDTAR